MSELRSTQEPVQQAPAVAPPVYFDARRELASRYLFGQGLEIGALHQPLTMPAGVTVRYVDRKSIGDLRAEYPELEDWNFTEVDVLDDGELLSTIADESQDFIVANHFLEHCENPIGTMLNHLGKLRPGGILFYAVPDKRFTFDFRRPVTPLEHMIADAEYGPEHSRREHYDEWVRLVDVKPGETDDQANVRARELERIADSIHMHVWTQAEFLQLIVATRERCDRGFEIEAAARQQIEFMVVLRKNGPLPLPHAELSASPEPAVVPIPARLRRKARALASRVMGR
jgi:SAM-dependent methyltransferase